MKVSVYIAKFLAKNNIKYIFEMSGGMITHLLDAIHKEGKINIISMHHEQSASFAADAYSRSCNEGLGVAMATSGPGATNLLTGMASCYFDSVPTIFITGQVNQKEQKGNKNIRQLGFQETDIISMAKPICKKCYLVESKDDIPSIFEEAIKIAFEGRQGPVLIDIPMNIQNEEIEIIENSITKIKYENLSHLQLDSIFWNDFYNAISKSKKPLILAGRGIIASRSEDLLTDFSKKTNIPVVSSLLGIGSMANDELLYVGMIGSYGNRWANLAIGDSDLILVLGSRLDIRQTGADVNFFNINKKIYHIDIDKNEINNRVKNCIPVDMDVSTFLQDALKNRPKESMNNTDWIEKINSYKEDWKDTNELQNIEGINPNLFFKLLSEHTLNNTSVYLADVGSHQMWAAQSIRLKNNQKFITSGGMGAMGYSFPAAIGAYFASGKTVITISGDGGFQLNIQELQTIAHHNLPIKIIIINNNSLGMIRQFQDSYFEGRHQSTVWGYSAPNFEKIATAYEIDSATISEENEIEHGLQKLFEKPNSPFLLQVMVDSKTNVYPKIAFGKPINEMEPFSKPIDMEGT